LGVDGKWLKPGEQQDREADHYPNESFHRKQLLPVPSV
jgi:hypothetical protein